MRTCIFLVFLGFTCPGGLFGQARYADVTEAQRTEVFRDNFDNNQHGWFVGSERKGRREASIQDGHYAWTSKSDFYQEHATWILVPLRQYEDFEIETAIKLVEGKARQSTALSWGRSDRGSFFFGFKDGAFFINSWHKISGLTYYVKQRKTPHLHEKEYNKLTVRKIDNEYQFFINEERVYAMPFKKFFGSNIGFESNNLIHVDYLRVSYLNTGSTPSPPLANTTEKPDQDTAARTEESHLAQVSDNIGEVADTTLHQAKTLASPVYGSSQDDSLAQPATATPAETEGEPPVITITEPTLTRGFKKVPLQTVRVVGQAADDDGIREVTINEQPAWLRSDGSFSLEVPLHVGDNAFTVTAIDGQAQQATTTFSIQREAPATEKRLALVIGNGAYQQGGTLRNPIHDANAMKTTLEQLGFTVLKYENCGQNEIKRAMDEFGQQLKGYDVGLFFYAGHGVQVDGSNYLIPVDARLTSAQDVEFDCVRADRVLAKMEAANARTNIVVLDACRDNPFERSWSRSTGGGNGLAFMNAPRGSLVAYATAPGQTASDGGGTYGVYTEALLEHLPTPDITIEQVFKRVRSTVAKKSNGQQIPWESTSLTGDFYFKR